ncbi:uncharacterized protein J4E88_000931 [Alternaria novae-zelandiae]|uniref:uncharacterized protein n=1 Tax=Alternaria triticimaculans TaxID=297637 RepID=UPI0020C5A0A2|nr:uncharacterized protein J4E78_003274 [Alternaria triticimaculans]XP_049260433.1 uncharacterized protein J4E88_000931 [Alternaria novae-zelandiae]KAI4665809.1 hypothetical protein J4E78_003274 [Alternaria triticimaculans]KAI4696753.1 hypothetical protein J4E88_000931 [Alternaria novae-zelandiae]
MDDPGLIFFEQTKFALNMISIIGLGLVKSSILVLYKNIFDYTGVFADIVILILPIPMVLSVRMEAKKKLAVIVMLSLGAAVCAVSITRVVATYSIAGEYLKHPDDVIYYTAPVFFWTNIELSLGVVCACLPTLRPIWFYFYPREATQTGSSYGYGSSGHGFGSSALNGTTKSTTFGGKLVRKPYQEIDEIELTARSEAPSTPPEDASTLGKRGITKEITIHQTLG